MKTEEPNYCCFCMSTSLKGSIIDSDILDLLKFIIVDVDINALENSTVCGDCLSKILAASKYKARNSSKMLMETNMDSKSVSILCQMCDKILEEETIPLVNCITQIDWLDFVNYLFLNQDVRSLENAQLCDTCHVSVSYIQDFLKLLYVYDRSKMKQNVNYDDKNVIEVKEESENLIEDDRIEMTCNRNDDDGQVSYDDFKCKNEELDLKMEHDSNDGDDQSAHLYEKVDCNEIAVHNSCGNEEEERVNRAIEKYEILQHNLNHQTENKSLIFKCQWCTYEAYEESHFNVHMKTHKPMRDFQCVLCSKTLATKKQLNRHLSKIHNYRDVTNDCNTRNLTCILCPEEFTVQSSLDFHLVKTHDYRDVACKVYSCDKCGYATTVKAEKILHNIKHGINDNAQILKCQECSYETYYQTLLNIHVKTHETAGDFKCSLCVEEFTMKSSLDYHLVKTHNYRNVACRVYSCDECGYATTLNEEILLHNIKHGRNDNAKIFKCHKCIYETHSKILFNIHVKSHENTGDFKCVLCSEEFPIKSSLDHHLVKAHNCKNVTCKMYDCDKCDHAITTKEEKLLHNHSQIFKCQECSYETYDQTLFNIHVENHENTRNFKCIMCSKEFTTKSSFDYHLVKTHNSRNVTCKVYSCDKCGYATTIKQELLLHSIKHGSNNNMNIFKCYHCDYETYYKKYIIQHLKKHNI